MLVYKKEIHGFDLHKMKVGISIEFLKDNWYITEKLIKGKWKHLIEFFFKKSVCSKWNKIRIHILDGGKI